MLDNWEEALMEQETVYTHALWHTQKLNPILLYFEVTL